MNTKVKAVAGSPFKEMMLKLPRFDLATYAPLIALIILVAFSAMASEHFLIPRNISVEYKSNDYLTVFKNLRPSGSSIDLSEYNGMTLDIEGEGFLEVKLIKSSIGNWDEQFYHTIELEDGGNEVEIPFAYFRNKLNSPLTVEDMKMITFTQKNLDGSSTALSLSNLKFTLPRYINYSTVIITKQIITKRHILSWHSNSLVVDRIGWRWPIIT